MSATTYFVALPFITAEDGELIPGGAMECPSAYIAEREARRLALTHAGAVAFSRSGDPNVGVFEDAKVLLSVGTVLTIDDLMSAGSS